MILGTVTVAADPHVVAALGGGELLAALGHLGGVLLRRRRPDLPRVVADNYAGTALLFVVTGAFLAVPVTAVLAVVVRYLDEVVVQRSREGPQPAPGLSAPRRGRRR